MNDIGDSLFGPCVDDGENVVLFSDRDDDYENYNGNKDDDDDGGGGISWGYQG